MRYKLRFYVDKDIAIPTNYSLELAKALKSLLHPKYLEFLEQSGFCYRKKIFKPYTFSRLFPEVYQIESNEMRIKKGYVDLVVCSIDENFSFSLLQGLLSKKELVLYENPLFLDSIYAHKKKSKRKLIVKTLSPIITKLKVPLNSLEGIEQSLKKNLIDKTYAFKGKAVDEQSINIKVFENTVKRTLISINGTPNEAITGLLMIEGDPDLIDVAYNTGVGTKNALGFGCIEDIKGYIERLIYKSN